MNIIHLDTGCKADFFPAVREDLPARACRNAHRIEYRGLPLLACLPKHVTVSKLAFYRAGGSDKRRGDIRAMPGNSGELLDRPALEDWIPARGVENEWRKVRA